MCLFGLVVGMYIHMWLLLGFLKEIIHRRKVSPRSLYQSVFLPSSSSSSSSSTTSMNLTLHNMPQLNQHFLQVSSASSLGEDEEENTKEPVGR